MPRMAEVAVRTNRFAALQPAIRSRPGANSGSKCNQECREREKKAFQFPRCGGVLDEAPHNVVALDQIGEKGGSNNELMKQRLVAIFKVSRFHRRNTSLLTRKR